MSEIIVDLAPVQQVDGVEFKRIIGAGATWLEKNAPYVNSLNVFPVPDGDTGTNMLLTMQAAMRETQELNSTSVGELCSALSRGALLGARGNSGVILSQVMRGFARSVDNRALLDASGFAEAMIEGARTAYKGVVKPVEGTILTVVREAGDASAQAAAQSSDFRFVLAKTVEGARAAVAKTPQLLPVLKQAGVVDAGGQGFLLLLEGASKALNGESFQALELGVPANNLGALTHEDGWGYDIQFHIRGDNLDVDEIRTAIASMGESALVVGDPGLIKVHVHAPNPGDILKFGANQGSLVNIMIENMQEQYLDFMTGGTADRRLGTENLARLGSGVTDTPAEKTAQIDTIAIVPGSGFRKIFSSLGVSALVSGGPSMNPSVNSILEAVETVPAEEVIILPNDKNIIFAANQVKELTSKRIQVIPTKSAPQGIAALFALNPQLDLEENGEKMTAALSQIRTIELTHANRSANMDGIQVIEGMPIALLDGELAGAGHDELEIAMGALELANARAAEIITVYYGDETTPETAQSFRLELAKSFPDQEIEIHSGGQPHYHYIISVE